MAVNERVSYASVRFSPRDPLSYIIISLRLCRRQGQRMDEKKKLLAVHTHRRGSLRHTARGPNVAAQFSLSLSYPAVLQTKFVLGPQSIRQTRFFFFFVSAQSVVSVVYIIRVSYVTKLILFYLGQPFGWTRFKR